MLRTQHLFLDGGKTLMPSQIVIVTDAYRNPAGNGLPNQDFSSEMPPRYQTSLCQGNINCSCFYPCVMSQSFLS